MGRHVPEESRDPERTPMPWDASPNAGFCPPDTLPWPPLTGDADVRNVAVQRAQPASELHLVRDLQALRAARPSLRAGRSEEVAITDELYACTRTAGTECTLVLLSFAARPTTLAADGGHDVLRSTVAGRDGPAGHALTLAPYEAVVLAPRSRGANASL